MEMNESVVEPLDAITDLVKVERQSTLLSAHADSHVHVNLVHNFVSLKSLRSEGSVYAFTSAHRGEGVSHVVELLAYKLASYTRAKILVITFEELSALTTIEIKQYEERWCERVPGVWAIAESSRKRPIINATKVEEEVWNALRAKFQYVLIDCPALDTGSQVLSIGGQIDGTVLIVCAGFGRKHEIQQATRLLSFGPGRLLGCILNRRTFPIPRLFFRFL